MIGPIVDSGSLAVGGILGVVCARWLPERVKETLPLVFGIIVIALGSTLVGKASSMHVVVLGTIVGSFIGELLRVERRLETGLTRLLSWSKRQPSAPDTTFMVQYLTLISLFCFGSMGIFGAVNEGITGKPDILLTKAGLDLFTAMIFGASMGMRVSLIAVPQFLIQASLCLSAGLFMPYVSQAMLNDFSSCGGIIFFATGLRMCGIKHFPVLNMLPSLIIVVLLSKAWSLFIG